ncbi:MAG: glutamate racemase [Clostridiales bacterium]|nr:glutamate racemase [Clostridiales bacterium]
MDNISERKNLPIGFTDSGLGGLSVLREAIRVMPAEDFIYYGDSQNAPYGTKPEEEIRNLTFAAANKLFDEGVKGLVVACNTATSAAVRPLRNTFPDMPIVGIEPAIKPAAMQSRGGRILVMATPMTVKLEKFHYLLDRYKDKAQIIPLPCEGLMEFVERGNLDGVELDAYFEEHLLPYITDDTETIVLGCTHYPFLRPHLKEFLGKRPIQIIDGSLGTALEMKRRLAQKGLLRTENRRGNVLIQNSENNPELIKLSHRLLSLPVE